MLSRWRRSTTTDQGGANFAPEVSPSQAEVSAPASSEPETLPGSLIHLSEKAQGKQPIRSEAFLSAEMSKRLNIFRVRIERRDCETSFGIGLSETNRVKDVDEGSAAARAGLIVWDLITEVDRTPARPGGLVEAVAGRLSVEFTIERPSLTEIEFLLQNESQLSPEWQAAIIASVDGDCEMLLESLQAMRAYGELTHDRRVSVNESMALANSSGLQIEPGKLLVELALEAGHPQLVQLLLTLAE